MNIKHYLSAATALALCAACSEYDPGLAGEAKDYTDKELALLNEYDANFVKAYGTPDPNHTWGFGEVGSEDETRSTRTVLQINKNEWITFEFDENRWATGYSTPNVFNEQVPGFPSTVDDKYYVKEVNNGAGATLDEVKQYLQYSNQQQINPIGDVTDEEILYVSTWFRTHQNPESDPFEADRFFVQTISKDYDRQNYGDMTGEKTSSWAETQSYPYINNLPIKYELNGVETNYDYNGNEKPEGLVGSPVTYQLDWLAVQSEAGVQFEHINNFNSANTPQIAETNPTVAINGTSYRVIEYVYDSGTYDFEVHSSNTDEMDHQWVLKHLTFTGRDGKNYDGWYLAFDIAYTKAEQTEKSAHGDGWDYYLKTRNEKGELIDVEGTWKKTAYRDYDGYYSNYIVKIIPGEGFTPPDDPEPEHNWYRIMCEDLGNTYDFDFNDLVFDVYYTGTSAENNLTAHIRVQAAGGTLPIYLGVDQNASYEAHRLLGFSPSSDDSYDAINVGGLSAAPKDFTLSVTSTNPDDIPIFVGKWTAEGTRSTTLLPKSGGTEISKTPQKICIPKGDKVKWLKEFKLIETAYTHFADWVRSEKSAYDFSGSTPWTTTDVDPTNLYTPKQ